MRIDQWVPALHKGDAIGDSTRLMRDAFRSWGHQAEVYALEIDDALAGEGRPFFEFRAGGAGDVVILHYALPSPLTLALREHRGRRVLIHHNVTPPHFFEGFDPEMVRICALGRAEVGQLRDHVDLALGDSEFNRKELEEAGFRQTGVLPILLDFAAYARPPGPVVAAMLRDGRTNLLFVGRIAPNKKQDDLIRLASYWRRFVAPDVRLVLVGRIPVRGSYYDALQALIYEEGFTPWDVVFTGHLDHRDLLSAYTSSHLFVSLSRHEGFGVPLVESMLLRLPILALATTAVADTLGDAGIRFDEMNLAEMAEVGHRAVVDTALRDAVLAGQDERVAAFAPQAVLARLRGHVNSL